MTDQAQSGPEIVTVVAECCGVVEMSSAAKAAVSCNWPLPLFSPTVNLNIIDETIVCLQ